MSVIYQYQCKDSSITDSYIGSTRHLQKRQNEHRYFSKCNRATPFHKFVLEHGGWENWECSILTECEEGVDFNERLRLEQAFIRQLKPTLNSQAAFQTKEERNEKRKINRQKLEQKLKEVEYTKIRNKKVFQCPCGKKVLLPNKARHMKSEFHLENSIADE